MSKDPIGISGGLNQYVFCGNNPVNFRDPWGLCDYDQKQAQDMIDRVSEFLSTDPHNPRHWWRTYFNKEFDLRQTLYAKKYWDVPGLGRMRSDQFFNYIIGLTAREQIGWFQAGHICFWGEVITWTNWKDAMGSWNYNSLGINMVNYYEDYVLPHQE